MHSPHCTPEHLGLYVLVGLFASGHRGPAQMAQTGAVLVVCLVMDAGQALCHGKHQWVLFLFGSCVCCKLHINESCYEQAMWL